MSYTNIEKPLIGCVLLNDRISMAKCLSRGVESEWFESLAGSIFYSKALERFGQGKYCDLRTMSDGENDAILSEAVDCVHSVVHLDDYIDALESSYLLRAAKQLVDKHQQLIKHSGDTIRDDLDIVRKDWMEISCGNQQDMTIGEASDIIIEDWKNPKPQDDMLTWPLESMQKHIGNISDEYIFLCAPESVGKTALALQMCVHLGEKGIPSSFASLESATLRVVPRLIGMIGKVNTWTMKNGKGNSADFYRADEAVKKLKELPINITERAMNIDQFHAWALTEKARGSKLLVVDNMKHIRMQLGNKSTNEHFREISLRAKWIRDDIGLPIVMLHHLTDEGDVSWSKDIRRDADILLYMTENEDETQRPTDSNKYVGKWINDILVAKNRDGDRGYKIQTQFVKEIQRFEKYEQYNG